MNRKAREDKQGVRRRPATPAAPEDLDFVEDLELLTWENDRVSAPALDTGEGPEAAAPDPTPEEDAEVEGEDAAPVIRGEERAVTATAADEEADEDDEAEPQTPPVTRAIDTHASTGPRHTSGSQRSLDLLRELDRAADTGRLTGAHRLRALQRAERRRRNLRRGAGSAARAHSTKKPRSSRGGG